MAEAQSPSEFGSQVGRGIALVLVANLLFAVVDVSTKWLLGAGLVVTQLAFMRYAVHFAITVFEQAGLREREKDLGGRVWATVILRALCLVSTTVVNFIALGHLSLSVTAAMLFLAPVFVCVFASAILGEAIRAGHVLAIAVGLGGALLIVWPFGEEVNWYAVLMLYPAASLALYQVLSHKLAGVVSAGTMQFATGLAGTLLLAPFVVLNWKTPQDALGWVLLLSIGALAWAGHEALTRGHASAKASTLAPFSFSFVVYLSLAGLIFFQDVPTANVMLGGLLIFVGGLVAGKAADRG